MQRRLLSGQPESLVARGRVPGVDDERRFIVDIVITGGHAT